MHFTLSELFIGICSEKILLFLSWKYCFTVVNSFLVVMCVFLFVCFFVVFLVLLLFVCFLIRPVNQLLILCRLYTPENVENSRIIQKKMKIKKIIIKS